MHKQIESINIWAAWASWGISCTAILWKRRSVWTGAVRLHTVPYSRRPNYQDNVYVEKWRIIKRNICVTVTRVRVTRTKRPSIYLTFNDLCVPREEYVSVTQQQFLTRRLNHLSLLDHTQKSAVTSEKCICLWHNQHAQISKANGNHLCNLSTPTSRMASFIGPVK